ncbi:MAG: hypothetical protein ABJE66_05945 [Deltaproteobacteria bacterium]
MPAEIQVGDRVHVSHLGSACQNPECAADPVVGVVVSVTPRPLGPSYVVRLPCGAEPTYTDGMIEAV